MSKRRKSKLVFCLFGALISWCFNGLNDKKIYFKSSDHRAQQNYGLYWFN